MLTSQKRQLSAIRHIVAQRHDLAAWFLFMKMEVDFPLGFPAYYQAETKSADLATVGNSELVMHFWCVLMRFVQFSSHQTKVFQDPPQATENSPALLIRFLWISRIFNRTFRFETGKRWRFHWSFYLTFLDPLGRAMARASNWCHMDSQLHLIQQVEMAFSGIQSTLSNLVTQKQQHWKFSEVRSMFSRYPNFLQFKLKQQHTFCCHVNALQILGISRPRIWDPMA